MKALIVALCIGALALADCAVQAADDSDARWLALVKAAIESSKATHNGTPRLHRVCLPKKAVCITTVVVGVPDGSFLVRHVAHPNGTTRSRETCFMNSTSDVVECTDWDTGAVYTNMLGADGEWETITTPGAGASTAPPRP